MKSWVTPLTDGVSHVSPSSALLVFGVARGSFILVDADDTLLTEDLLDMASAEEINGENQHRTYLHHCFASRSMPGFQNRSDLMLLDTGSIMLLLFGGLSVLLLGVLGLGMVLQFTSNIVLGALALSVLLAVDGLVLIMLSTNA